MRRLSLIWIFLCCLSLSALADVVRQKETVSQLEKELPHSEGLRKLQILEALSSSSWDDARQGYWLMHYYNECLSQDSLNLAEGVLADLSRYYHNTERDRQLFICSQKADILARIRGFYSNDYFVAKSYVCQRYMWNEDFEQAIYRTSLLMKLAVKVNNHDGQLTCEQLMGLIYQMTERHQNAIGHFEKAYQMQLTYKPTDYSSRAQMLTTLIEENLKLNRTQKAYSLIKAFEALQQDIQDGKFGNPGSFPFERNVRLMCSYYVDYAIRTRQLSLARHYLDKAASIRQSDVYVDFLIDYENALYCSSTGNYAKALQYIDKVIKADGGTTLEYHRVRADILTSMGNMAGAVEEYRKCLKLQTNAAHISFDRQLALLANSHQTMELQLRLKDTEISARKSQTKALAAVASLLLLLVIVFAFFLYHNRRLRKELTKDKSALEQSGRELQQALTKAYEVERMKNSFLHNVSHEIRTPLNAIVGFTSLLIGGELESEEERQHFTHIIQENSEALVTLVGNMIEISQLQSAVSASKDELKPCALKPFCEGLIARVQHSEKVEQGVTLTFSGTPEDYVLFTNEAHLQLVILHLINNAAKYTHQGSIDLSYRLTDDRRFVSFAVTDTGTGVSKEMRDTIFSTFEKGNTFVNGLGLGLPICRLLAESFGGSIRLDEGYKDGSRFVFTHSTTLSENDIKD